MLCKILAFLMLPCLVISSKMDMKPAFEDLNGTFDGNPEPMDPNLPGLDDLAIISDLDGASRLESNSLELRQSQGCNDNYPASSQCPSWASWACNSAQYANWMANNCKKSCNLCASSCTDNYPASSQCPSWASWACNSAVYANWMADNCKKSCNLCGGSGQTCSTTPSWMNFNGKIVGGMVATSSIPWQVQVRGSDGGFCGGTILDEYTILSAAHCKITGTSRIVAGATSLHSGSQNIRVKNAVNHPNYNSQTLAFDYSIAKLTSPLTFNTNVKAACLPSANFVPGSVAVASGWGSIKNYAGPISQSLRYVALPVGQCGNKLCVSGSGKWTCAGDSGGPLVVPRSQSDNTAVVIGITSGGYTDDGTDTGNCEKSFFASVSAELDWIKNTSGVA